MSEPFQPGHVIGDRYLITRQIGAEDSSECDAPDGATISILDGSCRCIVCARCGHHTGNAHQGHYWKACKVLAERLSASLKPGETLPVAEYLKRTSREDWHFCCPGDCELEPAGGAA
jgi:hypothetical protein